MKKSKRSRWPLLMPVTGTFKPRLFGYVRPTPYPALACSRASTFEAKQRREKRSKMLNRAKFKGYKRTGSSTKAV